MIYILIVLIAILMTMSGKGGGIFYVPLLALIGFSLDDAISASQVIIVLSALASFIVFRKNKVIDWKLILIAEPFTAVAAFFGAYLSSSFSSVIIKSIFIVSLTIPILFIFKKITPKQSHHFLIHRQVGKYKYSFNVFTAISISTIAGFAAGVSGIAGGSVKVPLFIGLCSIPPIIAIGSSSIMILITALSSIFGQFANSNLYFLDALPFAVSAIIGNFIGGKLSFFIGERYIKALIISTSLIAIVLMLIA